MCGDGCAGKSKCSFTASAAIKMQGTGIFGRTHSVQISVPVFLCSFDVILLKMVKISLSKTFSFGRYLFKSSIALKQ